MDWRELEAERVASGAIIHRPQWRCHHMLGDRGKTYNGIGLRRFIGNVAPRDSLAPQNAHPAPVALWKRTQPHPWGWIAHQAKAAV